MDIINKFLFRVKEDQSLTITYDEASKEFDTVNIYILKKAIYPNNKYFLFLYKIKLKKFLQS